MRSIRASGWNSWPKSAGEHDLWLLSDEVYWTLGGGEHISPRSLPGMAERTLVINSHVQEPWHDRLAHGLADRPGKR